LIEVLGGVDIKVSEALLVRPTVRWSRTLSNVDLYDLARTSAAVAVRWQF
jgi:hypothetical protein